METMSGALNLPPSIDRRLPRVGTDQVGQYLRAVRTMRRFPRAEYDGSVALSFQMIDALFAVVAELARLGYPAIHGGESLCARLRLYPFELESIRLYLGASAPFVLVDFYRSIVAHGMPDFAPAREAVQTIGDRAVRAQYKGSPSIRESRQ